MTNLRQLLRVCIHPSDEYNEMKQAGYWPLLLPAVLLTVWFLATVLEKYGTNFKFNLNNLEQLNILYMLASTMVLFAVFTVINWSITTLLDGKGTAREIYVSCAYALVPYIASMIAGVGLSYLITQDEAMLISMLRVAGVIWSGYIFITAQRVIHDYSFLKTLFCIALTLAGIVFVLFLLVLFFGLLQQLILFFQTIYVELRLR